jgi:hypothetical protein
MASESVFVYIARATGSSSFAELEVMSSDSVARLAKRACNEFRHWGVAADQVELFLVAAGGDAPTREAIEALIADSAQRLAENWSLARAGIVAGSWLVARVSLPPPAAAAASSEPATLMAQFWTALCSARPDDEERRSLTLTNGAEWGGTPGGGHTMFVRDCYKRLDAAVTASQFALVRGSPGIGKSMFALYHGWATLQREGGVTTIVYDYVVEASRKLRVIVEWGAARSVEPRLLERLLYAQTTLYIADGTAPSESSCRTLVVTSPKRDVWKEWAKVRDVTELFIPPFDAHEIKSCRSLCFPTLDEASVLQAFDLWGGSARLVLRHHAKAAKSAFQREMAASLTFDALECTVHDLASIGSASADTPQHVVHMIPDDSSLLSFHLRFASRHMSEIFYTLLQSAGEERIRRFLAASETSPSMGTLRGQVFERLALSTLCRAGVVAIKELGVSACGTPADATLQASG